MAEFLLATLLFQRSHSTERKSQETVLAHVGPMDTTHMISNVLVVHKDGSDTAQLKCYALEPHCPPGRGRSQMGQSC